MIRTLYALVAHRVIRDAEENRLSVVDLFEDMAAPGYPFVIPRISLVWTLARDITDPNESQATVTINLNENILMETNIAVNFQGGITTRAILVIGGIAITTPGIFTVRWNIPDQASTEYKIVFSSQPQVANPTGTNFTGPAILS